MASLLHSTPAPAQQPSLRAFIVCDTMPAGCIAHLVTDEQNAPHLRPGDIAIIDPDDSEPQIGELFLIEWNGGNRTIVEAWQRAGRFGSGPHGEMIDTVCWLVGGANRSRSVEQARDRLDRGISVGWVDGPYATEGRNAGALNKKLRGKVVGILEPAKAEPLRLLA